ncbi:hypothetical protein V1506DRAFT_527147 [Lipomyces tetrasporus]
MGAFVSAICAKRLLTSAVWLASVTCRESDSQLIELTVLLELAFLESITVLVLVVGFKVQRLRILRKSKGRAI